MILFTILLACTDPSTTELPDCPDGDTATVDSGTDDSGGDTGGGGGGDTGGGGGGGGGGGDTGGGGGGGGGGDTGDTALEELACPTDLISVCGELSGRAPTSLFAVALFPGDGEFPIAIRVWDASSEPVTFPTTYVIDETSFVDGTARPGTYTAKFIEDTNGDGIPDPVRDRVIEYPGTITMQEGSATQGIDFVVP